MNEPIGIQLNGKIYFGYETCPIWLKNKFRERVNYTCQDCKKHEDEIGMLEPHRIKRFCEGGLYMVVPINHVLNNVKMLCNKCHKKYNYSLKCP